MGFADTLKEAFNAILHPKSGTAQSMSTGGALKFYYTIMVIPLILSIILGYISGGAAVGLLIAGSAALSLIVSIPLSILIGAGVYYVIIGSLFKLFRAEYSKVVTAFTYAVVPYVFLMWIITPLTASLSLATVGSVIEIIAAIWSFITILFALSNQLSMSKLKAFGTMVLEGVIVGVIVFIITFLVGASLFGSLFSTSHLVGSTPSAIPSYP